jgi:hypothetical protein
VSLRVDTVAFALVAAVPVEDRGRVVLVELTADVRNHLGPIDERSELHVRVSRSGEHVEDLVLDEPGPLPTGFTHVTHAYRPDDGFRPGTWRFDVALVMPDATLVAPESPTVVVTAPDGGARSLTWLLVGVGVVSLVFVQKRGLWPPFLHKR